MSGWRRLERSLARIARTRYPPFLFGRPPRREIPVFTYHDVAAETLEADLDFLAMNGYRAVGVDEFHERMADGRPGDKLVLLTFDDARRSFADVVYPLLEKRGVRATLFVPTLWPGDVLRRFMSWNEIRHCAASGLIDVESHGHRHALVHCSRRLAGFVTPAAIARHDLYDWPMRSERDGDALDVPALGTPVYEAAPLLSAAARFLESPTAADACRELVAEGDGQRFFASRDWSKRLVEAHDLAARARPGEWLDAQSFRELVAGEVDLAVDTFARELGREPRYFAYPWMSGSLESQRRLVGAGIVAAFGVALDFRHARTEIQVYGRYKADWLRFLPGDGRRRLRDVVPQKLAAFGASQHFAH
jgi:peptidoglycan/xylan/chitin deacetylase (PgdA/CDA1 family)